jgi:hypothetical protein
MSEVPGIYTAYIWHNISVMVWRGSSSLTDLKQYERGCEQCRKRFPGGISAIHIIMPMDKQLPSSEVRDEMSRINDLYVDMVVAFAVVIFGGGFWAGAVRGLITALNMKLVRKRPFEMRTHANLEGVIEWLPAEHERRTGVKIAPQELLAVLRAAAATATPSAAG